MKWLLLVLLVSCGHESPPARDVGDSDGDTIPNYLEASSELQKYVAEVIPFTDTKATLTFKNENRPVTVELANKNDLAESALRLLTKTASTLTTEDYFSEWSKLRPVTILTEQLKDERYLVTLTFQTEDRPQFIHLEDSKAQSPIGKFTKRMEFLLTGAELAKVAKGEAHFIMNRSETFRPFSVEENIRKRTYRVYVFDGRAGKIHYVSNELPFEKYLVLSGAAESYPLENFKGFTSEDPEPFWWTRSIGPHDKVLVYESMMNLSRFHESNFEKTIINVTRVNGRKAQVLNVTKAPNTKFVLKFRASRELRTFHETRESWTRGGARGEINESCSSRSRHISATTTEFPTKEEILNEMKFQTSEKTMRLSDLAEFITEGVDERGEYLELALDETPAIFTLYLENRPASTYVKTGRYYYWCMEDRSGGEDTNEEGQMVIDVESFIEKSK